jgi:hypothetical protein
VEVRSLFVALLLTVGLLFFPAHGPAASSFSAENTVYFSLQGGATEAIVRELGTAHHRILVQVYSFTSEPIAKERKLYEATAIRSYGHWDEHVTSFSSQSTI